ncbi:MAG: hypothetical protein ACRC37_05460, partial [Lentisphaeria bacterium]
MKSMKAATLLVSIAALSTSVDSLVACEKHEKIIISKDNDAGLISSLTDPAAIADKLIAMPTDAMKTQASTLSTDTLKSVATELTNRIGKEKEVATGLVDELKKMSLLSLLANTNPVQDKINVSKAKIEKYQESLNIINELTTTKVLQEKAIISKDNDAGLISSLTDPAAIADKLIAMPTDAMKTQASTLSTDTLKS